MSYMDDFIHRLNMIPPQADHLLRQIRTLDREVEQLRLDLDPRRQAFLTRLHRWTDKRGTKIRAEAEAEYRRIATLEDQIEAHSKEKVALAERLYTLIHEPTEKLEKELQQRGLDRPEEEGGKKKRGKKPARKGLKRSEWEYDPNEPRYCYCSRPSYGEMVMCENTYCEREWFHVDCIDEKKLPEKWYCKHCRGIETPPPTKFRNK